MKIKKRYKLSKKDYFDYEKTSNYTKCHIREQEVACAHLFFDRLYSSFLLCLYCFDRNS